MFYRNFLLRTLKRINEWEGENCERIMGLECIERCGLVSMGKLFVKTDLKCKTRVRILIAQLGKLKFLIKTRKRLVPSPTKFFYVHDTKWLHVSYCLRLWNRLKCPKLKALKNSTNVQKEHRQRAHKTAYVAKTCMKLLCISIWRMLWALIVRFLLWEGFMVTRVLPSSADEVESSPFDSIQSE